MFSFSSPHRSFPALLLGLTLWGNPGCAPGDRDEDGFVSCEETSDSARSCDCDDANPAIFPGADELCDDVDQDCDEGIDEGVDLSVAPDADGDGFGDSVVEDLRACALPEGYAEGHDDCNDADANINPAAIERCDDLDQDCDGRIDEDTEDGDEDGYACEVDCDDNNPAIHPNAVELCNHVDENCVAGPDDGLAHTLWWIDADADGYGQAGSPPFTTCRAEGPPDWVQNDDDCDDTNHLINPAAADDCDQVGDRNCDGFPDGQDFDQDGFLGCQNSQSGGDCDDSDAKVFPGAEEICNGQDDDCNRIVDDKLSEDIYLIDQDGDSYGSTTIPAVTVAGCNFPYWVEKPGDCDDLNPYIHPGAPEVCDLKDNNCDQKIDDDDPGLTLIWYPDHDTDGYGDLAQPHPSCAGTEDFILIGGDCNDDDRSVHPGAQEICEDRADQDCDGRIDEGSGCQAATPVETATPISNVTPTAGTATVSSTPTSEAESAPPVTSPPPSHTEQPTATPTLENTTASSTDSETTHSPTPQSTPTKPPTPPPTETFAPTAPQDTDGDGYPAAVDCNDFDSEVHPDHEEVCQDGVDNNCDKSGCLLKGGYNVMDVMSYMFTRSPSVSTQKIYIGYDVLGLGDYDENGSGSSIAILESGNMSGRIPRVTYLDSEFSIVSGNMTYYTPLWTGFADGFSDIGLIGDINHDRMDDLFIQYTNVAGDSFLNVYTSGKRLYDYDTSTISTADLSLPSLGTAIGFDDANEDGMDEILWSHWSQQFAKPQEGVACISDPSVSAESCTDSIAMWHGNIDQLKFGTTAIALDFNNDGYEDVAFGSLNSTFTAFLFLGPHSGVKTAADADLVIKAQPNNPGSNPGLQVWEIGDYNGDGCADLAVTCAVCPLTPDGDRTNRGGVYIILGCGDYSSTISLEDPTQRHALFIGRKIDALVAGPIAGGMDINQDGRDDLLIGDPYSDVTGEDYGAVYLILGGRSGDISLLNADLTIFGSVPNSGGGSYRGERLGFSVSWATDLDGVTPAILAGAPNGGSDTGAAYLIPTRSY